MNDDLRPRDAPPRSELASTIGIIVRCAVLAAVLTSGVWIGASYIIPYLIAPGR